ncbi:thioredoxin [Pseudomonas sp. PSE14]|uniref:thioredoxin n=1 Tax=Pseudomonas TaxID=286 RepID=UPI0023D857BB|nr:thioredoxin [Pseudomonas sp. PSE14]WEJ70414.1 thioredoxin [Pseudomonas sp. PSE14]
MTECSDRNLSSIGHLSIVPALELTDLDADRRLLSLPGVSLLVFTSEGCSSCRWARAKLPEFGLPVDRLCWIDAGRSGGLVARYGVFHLPAMFLVRDGHFLGPVHAALRPESLIDALRAGLSRPAEELP